MNASRILLLPGWQNSGAGHWQSQWQHQFGYLRVEQHDWMRPLRGDWIARLEDVLLSVESPVPCWWRTAWAASWWPRGPHIHVTAGGCKAALLVAPGDAERDELRPVLPSWSPPVLQRLPFRSCLVASSDDPYCSLDVPQNSPAPGVPSWSTWAHWGISMPSPGWAWPQGQDLLQDLISPLRKETHGDQKTQRPGPRAGSAAWPQRG
jgi:predicted alpha/beta hydrolase family esterase